VEAGTIIPTDDELAARRAEAEADGPKQLAEPDDEPTGIASSTQLERPGAGDQSGEQLSLIAGGNAPTTTSMRLTGGKIDVPGEFDRGQRIVLRVECVVRGQSFVDQEDAETGQINATERRHSARITGVRVIES
jgi:hypothetical protein